MGLSPQEDGEDLRVVCIRAKKSDQEINDQLDLLVEYNPEEDN
jgi:hypothetical protein